MLRTVPLEHSLSVEAAELQRVLCKRVCGSCVASDRAALCAGHDHASSRGACVDGHVDVVDELLDANASTSRTAIIHLKMAAFNGHTTCVTTLPKASATVNSRLNFADTPLHLAALEGHAACVTALLEASVSVDSQDGTRAILPHKGLRRLVVGK